MMKVEKHSVQEPEEWYAVSDGGASAIRITPGLKIGETESGALALNDPAPQGRWIEFTRDDQQAPWIEAVSEARSIWREGGEPQTRQPLSYGARLVFPHNTLVISPDISVPRRTGPQFRIGVPHPLDHATEQAEPSVAALASLRLPPQWDDIGPLPSPGSTGGFHGEPEDQARDPDAAGERRREYPGLSREDEPFVFEELPPPAPDGAARAAPPISASPPPNAAPPISARKSSHPPRSAPTGNLHPEPSPRPERDARPGNTRRRAPLALLVALLAGAVVALALSRPLSEEWDPQARLSEFGNHVMALVTGLIDDGDSPGAGDGPLEPSDLATETPVEEERAALRSADETVAASTPEPAPIPAAEVRTEIPEDSAGPGNLAGPSDAEKETPAGQPLTEAQAGAPGEAPRDWPEDERLDRARVLLDQGYITYPPGGNAVALLVDVLEDHPGHPRAMDMLDESTVRLIEAARQARARGLDYEARNSLEEVLGFNPDNATANRLWREWIGEDR